MAQYQQTVLGWMATQPWFTGAVVFAVGLLSAFYGFRMARLLLPGACAAAAWVTGDFIARAAGLPEVYVTPAFTAAVAVLAIAWPRVATTLGGGVIWGVLAAYVLGQFGLKGLPVLIGLGFCACAGAVLAIVCRQSSTVLLTSVLGGSLMIAGFVGLASTFVPTLSTTFCGYAREWPLSVPVILTMLVTMAYSCQANWRQGDLCTGTQLAH